MGQWAYVYGLNDIEDMEKVSNVDKQRIIASVAGYCVQEVYNYLVSPLPSQLAMVFLWCLWACILSRIWLRDAIRIHSGILGQTQALQGMINRKGKSRRNLQTVCGLLVNCLNCSPFLPFVPRLCYYSLC
ncbi:hypothetical protein BDW59DRAFT_149751 [Aspergillus cavernicola]|uniref:Uncharacterized protein n=1 Tax=Aspergillus cavernicola TaxID=176166 RepID=A0ABR4I3H8_9EURO